MKHTASLKNPAAKKALLFGGIGLGIFLICLICRGFSVGIRFLFFFCGALGLALCLLGISFFPFSSALLKKLGKVYRTVLLLGLCLFVLLSVSFEISISRYAVTDAPEGAGYMIVYGAGVNRTVPSAILQKRIDAAADYLTENPDTLAVLSGSQGSGEDITEAEAIYRALVGKGISPDRLIREEKARNTVENTEYSLALLEEKGYTDTDALVLVTNDFHLYRVRRIATGCGAKNISGIAAEMPKLPLFRLTYHLREYFSLGKQMLLELFHG